MTFSERQGLKPIRQILRTDSMDSELRNRVWNVLRDHRLSDKVEGYTLIHRGNATLRTFCITLWHNYFKEFSKS
jgi:hypothetical protein